MFVQDEIAFLQAEIDRASIEVRSALSSLMKAHRLPPQLMSVATLIDRVECHLTFEAGESAFELSEDGKILKYRASVVRTIVNKTRHLADEVGVDLGEANRIHQTAINLFVIHELLHIRQNFPHFATVATIKEGAAGLGLPLLDLAADVLSAWICAHVQCDLLQDDSESTLLKEYSNCLILSYLMGAFVYDARTKPEKRQRAIGLIVSAILVQAKLEGRLNDNMLFDNWQPASPILVLDLEKCGTFNAIVLDQHAGLLLQDAPRGDPEKLSAIWNLVGRRPIFEILKLVGSVLMELGVINA